MCENKSHRRFTAQARGHRTPRQPQVPCSRLFASNIPRTMTSAHANKPTAPPAEWCVLQTTHTNTRTRTRKYVPRGEMKFPAMSSACYNACGPPTERRTSAVDQAQVDREAAHTLRLRATKAGLLGSLRDHAQVAWERNVGWAVWRRCLERHSDPGGSCSTVSYAAAGGGS